VSHTDYSRFAEAVTIEASGSISGKIGCWRVGFNLLCADRPEPLGLTIR
jgi:hypothetical protein